MFDVINNQELLNISNDALKSGAILIETDQGRFHISMCDCSLDGANYIFENSVARFRIAVFDKGGETANDEYDRDCNVCSTIRMVTEMKPSEDSDASDDSD